MASLPEEGQVGLSVHTPSPAGAGARSEQPMPPGLPACSAEGKGEYEVWVSTDLKVPGEAGLRNLHFESEEQVFQKAPCLGPGSGLGCGLWEGGRQRTDSKDLL